MERALPRLQLEAGWAPGLYQRAADAQPLRRAEGGGARALSAELRPERGPAPHLACAALGLLRCVRRSVIGGRPGAARLPLAVCASLFPVPASGGCRGLGSASFPAPGERLRQLRRSSVGPPSTRGGARGQASPGVSSRPGIGICPANMDLEAKVKKVGGAAGGRLTCAGRRPLATGGGWGASRPRVSGSPAPRPVPAPRGGGGARGPVNS